MVAIGLLAGWAGAGHAAPPPTPRATEAAVYDPATRNLVLDRDADRPVPVASLVKLMTARLALESGDLARLITVPPGVTALPETKVGLVPGERVPLSVLLSALLVRSGNDAAYTVATGLAGSETAFAVRMNAEAGSLGLRDTHYVNSSGLDAPGQHSSAADVAALAAADLSLPGFAAMVDQSSVAVDGRSYKTVNPFLAYYPEATGIKTGFTSSAMFCLAASARRGGRTLIAVVLGEPDWDHADADAGALLDWAFAQAGAPPAPVKHSAVEPAVTPTAVPAASAAPGAIAPPAAAATAPATDAAPTPVFTPAAPPPVGATVYATGRRASPPPRPPLPWVAAGAAVAALAVALGLWLCRR